MDIEEFRKRLLRDPEARDPALREALAKGGEYTRIAREEAGLDARIADALKVPVPEGLAEDVILGQAMEAQPSRRRMRRLAWPVATAAAVVLAVTVTLVSVQGPDDLPPPTYAGIEEILAHHWQTDGISALNEVSAEVPEIELQQVMASLGLDLGAGLRDKVRFVKFCPAPDGVGAHLVLATADGPVTLFYLPGARSGVDDQFVRVEGMSAWVADLETGTLAVMAPREQSVQPLVGTVREEFRVRPTHEL